MFILSQQDLLNHGTYPEAGFFLTKLLVCRFKFLGFAEKFDEKKPLRIREFWLLWLKHQALSCTKNCLSVTVGQSEMALILDFLNFVANICESWHTKDTCRVSGLLSDHT